jgi:cytochrome P450
MPVPGFETLLNGVSHAVKAGSEFSGYLDNETPGSPLKLPPVLHYGSLAKGLSQWGMWRRHRIEAEASDNLGPIFCIVPPPGGTAKIFVFVSDPELVQQVMTDRETFPSRGQTGFSTTLGQGLLALRTGPVWARHRRIVSKFLSDKYLQLFAAQIQTQTEVMLAKWALAAENRSAVNAQYDLSTLTEDIIGCIAFGKEFGSQQIPEGENQDAANRDLMLKEVVLRTANPLAPYFATSEHKKRLVQIGLDRSARSKGEIICSYYTVDVLSYSPTTL